MEKEGYEGEEEEGMEDGAPPPYPTAAMAADDGEEPRTRSIMRVLYARYRKQARRWHNYRVLFSFLAFMLLFLIVLFLQRTAGISYAVHATIADVVTPAAEIFNSKEDIYDWLEGLVRTVWADPVCGDGQCELPFEYPSYGGFGCKSDCGRMPQKFAVTPIQIDLYFDFSHPLGSLPASVRRPPPVRRRAAPPCPPPAVPVRPRPPALAPLFPAPRAHALSPPLPNPPSAARAAKNHSGNSKTKTPDRT